MTRSRRGITASRFIMWIAFAGSLLPWMPHLEDFSGSLHEAESALIRSACLDASWELPATPDSPARRVPLGDAPVLFLDGDGRLPPVAASFALSGGFHRSGPLRYHAFVEYDENKREDGTETVSGETDADRCAPDFGDTRQGGRYRLEVEIPWKHDNGRTGTLRVRGDRPVRGVNPDKAAIRELLGDAALRVIAYRESRFRQFDATGRPLLGHPRGYGIMQLDTPPPTAGQIWDWRANIEAGRALFASKRDIALRQPVKARETWPDATDFTEDQLRLETYQRYNGGAYWRWDDSEKAWVRCARNDYADRCLEIEQTVAAGEFPVEWE